MKRETEKNIILVILNLAVKDDILSKKIADTQSHHTILFYTLVKWVTQTLLREFRQFLHEKHLENT